jgi:hypothetical protein
MPKMLSLQKRYLVVCGAVAVARSSPAAPEFSGPSVFTAFFTEENSAYKMTTPSAFADWVAAADTNKNEVLDEAELGGKLALKFLDTNGDGSVSLQEMSMAKALALFGALDRDSDGELGAVEVPQAFIDVVENLDGFVENNDGKLDEVEFSNFFAKVKPKPKKPPVTWAEVSILGIAGGMACLAAYMLLQSWRKSTSTGGDTNSLLGVESYELDYPPEVMAFQELRDNGETDVTVLKRALFKRAVATVPMRLYVQAEEKNVQRMYHNSMISPESWANFQQCVEEVKVEMEVIKEEAEAIMEGWSESVLQEAHWLFQHVEEEKKAVENLKNKVASAKAEEAAAKEAAMAEKAASEAAKQAAASKEAKDAQDRLDAIASLEREAAAEEAKKEAQKKKK